MRDPKDAENVVAERLKAVMAKVPAGVPGPPPGRREPLAGLARVGEPLQWSDIIPGWAEPSFRADEFPAGSAWASPPSADPGPSPVPRRVGPGAPPGEADRVLTPDDFDGASWEIVSPGVTSVPPSWVLPEQPRLERPEDPLAHLGVSESWAAPPAASGEALSGAGAFGAAERKPAVRAFDPGRRGVRALAAVAVLVVVVAAFLAWRARPRVEPVAAPSFGGATGQPAPSVEGSAVSDSPEVIVAVEGKVQKPGVVHLPTGSRVADALQAAGGAQPGVDVAMLNLARKVVDGELILVGVTPSPGMSMPAAPAAGGPAPPGGLVNLNTATLADLDTLPGVGPVLAQRILDARTAQGGFQAVSDLRKVDGIGDARYEQLKDLVTV